MSKEYKVYLRNFRRFAKQFNGLAGLSTGEPLTESEFAKIYGQ